MKLNAKARLLEADADAAAREAQDSRKNQIHKNIDNLQKQVEDRKKSMPSRQNRMSVSPRGRIGLQKQILKLKDRIADQRLNLDQTKVSQS